jgi:hypothetical protein
MTCRFFSNLSTCRQISNLSICRSVNFSRQINKSADQQIDRSTDQQSTNLIWDTKTTKKQNFFANKICRQICKKNRQINRQIWFLGHPIRFCSLFWGRPYFPAHHLPALILGFLAGKENETKNHSRYRRGGDLIRSEQKMLELI